MYKVLANKNFRNLWFAQIISQIAVNMMVFILAIRVYQETRSNTAVSITFLAIGLPALLLGVPAGVAADQTDKKQILVVSNIARGALVLGFFIFYRNVAAVYLLAFIISAITQFFVPAEGAMLADMVKKKDLLAANSLFSLSFYSSVATGFILSGPAMRIFGVQRVFIFLSFCLFLAGYFVMRLPGRHKGELLIWVNIVGKARKLIQSVAQGFVLVKKRSDIMITLLLITLTQVIVTVFSALMPGFADHVLHIQVENASYLVMGPIIIGVLVGSLFPSAIGYKVVETKQFIASVLLLCSVLIITMTMTPFRITIILLFLLGLAQALLLIPSYTALQKNVAGQFRGRIYGVLTSFIGGASIIPAVIAGTVADYIGVARTIQLLGVVIGTFGFYKLYNSKLLRNKTRL